MENREDVSPMSGRSSVDFPGSARVHIALAVKDLGRSLEFYEALLGQPPSKVRTRYGKFEPREPSLNLALNETPAASGAALPSHFGVQLKSSEEVLALGRRLERQGLSLLREEGQACCYAVQDKVWVEDPDGNQWEVFVVLGESDRLDPSSCCEGAGTDCCETAGTDCCETASADYRETAAVEEGESRGACCEGRGKDRDS